MINATACIQWQYRRHRRYFLSDSYCRLPLLTATFFAIQTGTTIAATCNVTTAAARNTVSDPLLQLLLLHCY